MSNHAPSQLYPNKPFANFVRFVVISFSLLALSACEQRPQVYQQQILALGTLVDISIYGTDMKTAQDATLAITKTMEKVHHDWHPWQPGKLTAINQSIMEDKPYTLDDDGKQLISAGITLSKKSSGLFNPAIGEMIALWGFHHDERPDTAPPSQQAINNLLNRQASMDDLSLEDSQLSSVNPDIQLDFGAFAKGYAVDLAIAELRQRGITNAIVNAGGDLRAIGSKGKQPWRIGIRHPRQAGVIASLETHGDESVFTSGDYERYFDYQGKRYHHIIDPRTGYPAKGSSSVTIIHQDATTADAAATALFIAGPEQWRDIAKKMGVEYAMLIDKQGSVYMTQGMAERIHFETDPPPKIIIVP